MRQIKESKINVTLEEQYKGNNITYIVNYTAESAPEYISWLIKNADNGMQVSGAYHTNGEKFNVNVNTFIWGMGEVYDHIFAECKAIVAEYTPSV